MSGRIRRLSPGVPPRSGIPVSPSSRYTRQHSGKCSPLPASEDLRPESPFSRTRRLSYDVDRAFRSNAMQMDPQMISDEDREFFPEVDGEYTEPASRTIPRAAVLFLVHTPESILGSTSSGDFSLRSTIAEKVSQRVLQEVMPQAAGNRLRILVTGGAGFVGSHLVDTLIRQGHHVTVLDNLYTGTRENIQHWIGHPSFQFLLHDVTEPINMEVDRIYHLAAPASPPHYQYNPIKTIKTNVMGTMYMLGLAKRVRARFLLASAGEIYGHPQENPQSEVYWGNVNTIGPRACYEEGKRVAETMTYAYQAQGNVEVRVARIFNTYGPRMTVGDGRVMSNFILQALQGKNITIYGDGTPVRTFQFVDDLVDGLIALMESDYDRPVNLGSPEPITLKDLAERVHLLINSSNVNSIVHLPRTIAEARTRQPNISIANKELGWNPRMSLDEGLLRTIKYFQETLNVHGGSVEIPGPAQFAAVVKPSHRPPWHAAVQFHEIVNAESEASETPSAPSVSMDLGQSENRYVGAKETNADQSEFVSFESEGTYDNSMRYDVHGLENTAAGGFRPSRVNSGLRPPSKLDWSPKRSANGWGGSLGTRKDRIAESAAIFGANSNPSSSQERSDLYMDSDGLRVQSANNQWQRKDDEERDSNERMQTVGRSKEVYGTDQRENSTKLPDEEKVWPAVQKSLEFPMRNIQRAQNEETSDNIQSSSEKKSESFYEP